MSVYRKTLHGGVASTIAAVRSLFWLPVLRKLTKTATQNFMVVKGSEHALSKS